MADCGAAVERKEHRGLPGENVCGGIRAPPDLVLLHTLRPRCVTARGGTELSVGALQFLPNLPKPRHVIRDKDRGLSYSTSILPASHKAAHPWPPEELLDTAASPAPVYTSELQTLSSPNQLVHGLNT